jgi:hypothetical protein
MLKITTLALSSALLLGSATHAHEVWLERDGAGPARVYLGEPAEPVPPNGDPEFPKLKAPVVFTTDSAAPAALTRKADHIEAAIKTPGDVRAQDSNVFDPWTGEGDKLEGAAYYARAGRTETATKLDLEIAPVTTGSDTFVVVWKGQPLADASVNIVNPDRWQKSFKTDAAGKVAVPTTMSGRYLLAVSHPVEGEATVAGKAVTKVYHTSTLTFVK